MSSKHSLDTLYSYLSLIDVLYFTSGRVSLVASKMDQKNKYGFGMGDLERFQQDTEVYLDYCNLSDSNALDILSKQLVKRLNSATYCTAIPNNASQYASNTSPSFLSMSHPYITPLYTKTLDWQVVTTTSLEPKSNNGS